MKIYAPLFLFLLAATVYAIGEEATTHRPGGVGLVSGWCDTQEASIERLGASTPAEVSEVNARLIDSGECSIAAFPMHATLIERLAGRTYPTGLKVSTWRAEVFGIGIRYVNIPDSGGKHKPKEGI